MRRIIPAALHRTIAGTPAYGMATLISILLLLNMASCQLSESDRAKVHVRIEADGRETSVEIPVGSTAAQALQAAGLSVGNLDKSEPPLYAVVEDGSQVRLTRVEEKFRTETRSIAFDRQVLRNESLPEGEERLVQAGVNGEDELTFRTLLEDGVPTSDTVIKTVRLSEPVSEIVMIGSRSALSPMEIPGRIAYVSGGNAWIMDTTTANRRLVVGTADLDGRVFSLSPDAKYLLFTRKSSKPADQEINTLWVAPTEGDTVKPRALKVSNVISFAAWYPNSTASIAYSTVEPRANAPGWQSNNDLYKVNIHGTPAKILDAQSGGIYGWWGTFFAFSPNGRLAYARPDGIGLVSQDGGYLAPVATVTPLQTHADWAWAPGVAWGLDSQLLVFVDHVAEGASAAPEESRRFDLKAVSLLNNTTVTLAENVGMFAFPSVSKGAAGDASNAFQIGFLQAIFPEQSDVSRYRLDVMDRDGSNRRTLFPPSDQPGLEPQRAVWAPGTVPGQAGQFLCVIYQGNLWLIDSASGLASQVTGDGLISGVDWQ